MTASLELLQKALTAPASAGWAAIFAYAWQIFSPPVPPGKVGPTIVQRDRDLEAVDLFLASAAWDLWQTYDAEVEHTADALASWWNRQLGGKAVLILDGLSLREVPWLLQGAQARGFQILQTKVTGAELPADTTPFAQALGFAQRSALANNQAGHSHRLAGAVTESLDLPWIDCSTMIGSERHWVLWHHWPDNRVHELGEKAGSGLDKLALEAEKNLTSDDFWALVERLATGRRLVITSDHGYAASSLFANADGEQADYLKSAFKNGRWADPKEPLGNWNPPIDVVLDSRRGCHRYVLGRRKWKGQSGYPTLTHGGLSVLEVASPFIEISKG
ncbi:MAG: hypothetical protein ACHWZW_04705 [Spirulina sp.]